MALVVLTILETILGHYCLEMFVQNDNDNPLRILDILESIGAFTNERAKITLLHKPTNSPDSNVFDFRLYNSSQSLRNETNASTIDKLIHCSTNAISQSEFITLDSVWITLQSCVEQIV